MGGVCSPEICRENSSIPLDQRQALERHTQGVNYENTVASQTCNENLVCGTPLDDHRDPLLNRGGIHSGLIDVNGDGHIDCKDVHDACFLDYPVEHEPHPAHSAEDFTDMFHRNRAILAMEDIAQKGLEPEELEVEMRRIATDSGLSIDDLRETLRDVNNTNPPVHRILQSDPDWKLCEEDVHPCMNPPVHTALRMLQSDPDAAKNASENERAMQAAERACDRAQSSATYIRGALPVVL